MNIQTQRELVKRLLRHIDDRSTDMADFVYEMDVAAYTSNDWWERERRILFAGELPLLVGLSSQWPGSGSFRTMSLAGTPVLITRDADGELHAMVNVCRHRGIQLVDGAGKGARRFSCPFHGWTYDIGGKLLATTGADAFAGVCKEDRGLIRLPVAERYGLVFVAPRPGGDIDVDEHLEGLAPEIGTFNLEDWQPISEAHTHDIKANWKVALDTFAENYHFAYLHRDTLAKQAYGNLATFDAFGRHLRNSSAQRSINELRDTPEEEWVPLRHIACQYRIFPNATLTITENQVQIFQLFPGETRTTSYAIHSTFVPRFVAGSDEIADLVRRCEYVCETVVQNQDFWAASRTEPGLSTGLVPTLLFGRNEPGLHHLHEAIKDVIWTDAAVSTTTSPA